MRLKSRTHSPSAHNVDVAVDDYDDLQPANITIFILTTTMSSSMYVYVVFFLIHDDDDDDDDDGDC